VTKNLNLHHWLEPPKDAFLCQRGSKPCEYTNDTRKLGAGKGLSLWWKVLIVGYHSAEGGGRKGLSQTQRKGEGLARLDKIDSTM
jgi:hypothetical protein